MDGRIRRAVSALAATAIACVGLFGCGGASASSPQRVADQLEQTDSRPALGDRRVARRGDPPSSAPPQEVLDQAAALQADARYLAQPPNLEQRR